MNLEILKIFTGIDLYSVYRMPPARNALWEFFFQDEKQNTSHFKAYCHSCIKNYCPADLPINIDNDTDLVEILTQDWFKPGNISDLKLL